LQRAGAAGICDSRAYFCQQVSTIGDPDPRQCNRSVGLRARDCNCLGEIANFDTADGHICFNLESRLSARVATMDDGVSHPTAGEGYCLRRFQPARQIIGSGWNGDGIRASQRVSFLHGSDEAAQAAAIRADTVARVDIRVHCGGIDREARLDAAFRARGCRRKKQRAQ